MGTLRNSYPQRKEDFVKEILQSFNGDTLLLASSLRGNNLWVLLRRARSEQIVIGLFLLSCYKGCWGEKSLSEDDGPFQYDCPLSFLDRAPEPGSCPIDGHAGEPRTTWRDHVRRFHAAAAERRRTGRPKVGDEIVLADARFPGFGGTYRVTQDLGRRGLELNGYLRMKAHQLKWAERKTTAISA